MNRIVLGICCLLVVSCGPQNTTDVLLPDTKGNWTIETMVFLPEHNDSFPLSLSWRPGQPVRLLDTISVSIIQPQRFPTVIHWEETPTTIKKKDRVLKSYQAVVRGISRTPSSRF